MAKIILDPEESGIEAFAKLFFSATRNMGLSDKEACEARLLRYEPCCD